MTAVAIDRIATWRTDHDLALQPRVRQRPVRERRTGRAVPHASRRSRSCSRSVATSSALPPTRCMFNYTNPENRVCLALHRYTSTRIVGLCHSLAEAIDACARVARPAARHDRGDRRRGRTISPGSCPSATRRDGSDLMPEFRRRTLAGDPTRRRCATGSSSSWAATRRSTMTMSANTCRGPRP